jgi:hypothetical protein
MNAHLLGDAFMGTSNRPNPFGTAPRSGDVFRSCAREILQLTAENARLTEELARARVRNQDLTQSAELWIRLYEAQLARANGLARQTAALRMESPRS